jgi:hypothetical protein
MLQNLENNRNSIGRFVQGSSGNPNGVTYHNLAKNMGTSIGMLEKHYSHLTPTLAANELAGKRHPDRA